MEENEVHIRRAKVVSGLESLFRSVDEAKIDDLDSWPPKLFLDDSEVVLEPLFNPANCGQ